MNGWPYNTARWRRLRALVLSSEPYCRYCAEMGRTTLATEVDHTIPVRARPDMAFDPGNTVSICAPCHSGFKRRWETSGVRPGCDVDGVPSDAAHHWAKAKT